MTETEWLACLEPKSMLHRNRLNFNKRKLGIFACACCRMIWHLLDKQQRQAVEATEQFADGIATRQMFLAVCGQIEADFRPPTAASKAVVDAINVLYVKEKSSAIACADFASGYASTADGNSAAQAALLRDIFGNPFRPVTLDPAWQTANVVALAQGIYAERAFERMPILGDALEDAGCDNADILNHCRQGGEHVRGCWVVDLILGKE
jgi:hypothetical protein